MRNYTRRVSALLSCAFLIACNSIFKIEEAEDITEDRDLSDDQREETDPDLAFPGSQTNVGRTASGVGPRSGVCGPGEKFCAQHCVSVSHAKYGCGPTCGTCVLPNVDKYKCDGATCGISTCASGWADCNKDASDGCEAELWMPKNCSECGHVCPESTPYCAQGICSDTPPPRG